MKGNNVESEITEDRVVVFDDPVSSLDSEILFIVSSLIKKLFEEVNSNSGYIKQVFVFTHNIYFHKEVSFSKNKGSNRTFWIIKKDNNCSKIEHHKINPIRSSYELLWKEVQDSNRSNSTIRNTLRRILEHYYKILGDIKLDDITDKFYGKDKLICGSLIAWVHDGSHLTDNDLYISCDEETVNQYLRVFENIFIKSGHKAHYDMMMRINE